MGLQFRVVGKLGNNSPCLLLRIFPTLKHTFQEPHLDNFLCPSHCVFALAYERGMILADDRLPEWNQSRFFFDLLNGSSKLV